MNYTSWTVTVNFGDYFLHYTKSEDYSPWRNGVVMKKIGSQGLSFYWYMWKASTLIFTPILYLTQLHPENVNRPTFSILYCFIINHIWWPKIMIQWCFMIFYNSVGWLNSARRFCFTCTPLGVGGGRSLKWHHSTVSLASAIISKITSLICPRHWCWWPASELWLLSIWPLSFILYMPSHHSVD